jgi:hypothetical protein
MGTVGRAHRRIAGLFALVALLALSGLGAAGASAAEFKATAFPVSFTASGGKGFLETESGDTVECREATGTGELASAHTVAKVSVHFKGCKAYLVAHVGELLSCHSVAPGSPVGGAEEIITDQVKGQAVDVNSALTEAGILLSPETGESFAEFVCAGSAVQADVKVRGSIIGKVVSPLKTKSKEVRLEFALVKPAPFGTPVIAEYFGEPHGQAKLETSVEGTPEQGAGIEEETHGTTVTRSEQEVEVDA